MRRGAVEKGGRWFRFKGSQTETGFAAVEVARGAVEKGGGGAARVCVCAEGRGVCVGARCRSGGRAG